MHNLKISTRIGILVAAMSLLLVLTGLISLYGLGKTNAGLKTVYEDRTVALGQLATVQALDLQNRLTLSEVLLRPQPDEISSAIQQLDKNISAGNKQWADYMATYLTPDEEVIAKKLAEQRASYLQSALAPAVAALKAASLDEVKKLDAELQAKYVPLHQSLEKLIQLQLKVAKEEFDAAEQRHGTVSTVSISAMVLGTLFAVLFGMLLIKNISQLLAQSNAVATAVADGDLTYPIKVDGNNEVAQLLRTLTNMQGKLQDMVSRVRVGSDEVSLAATEIAHGNQDLSARTESQASSLEETSASMEELNATVQQNAENARQANQLAKSASAVAVEGGKVVSQVVDTMKGINESSSKIADIISVIDGIAFQTNILALNAAVEAARAGDQGRGFAVVASEVRSLAGRSAEAAKEIKRLISVSVERVAQGSSLVDQAGTTMDEVVSSIRRVTDIMGEISTASAEQSSGVTQIGNAVVQMDQATQQNAALVEEMAAATLSLRTQANELVETVAIFKLPAGLSKPPTRAPAKLQTHHFAAPKAVLKASPKTTPYRPPAGAKAKPIGLTGPSTAVAVSRKPTPPAQANEDWESF